MTDPNDVGPDGVDDQAVESGGIGFHGDAAEGVTWADPEGAGMAAPGCGGNRETLADKAALVDADSILDPVTPESGKPPN